MRSPGRGLLTVLTAIAPFALTAPASAQGAAQIARSQDGMVVAAQPLAAAAGARMLELGGNAADAAVAAGFAIAVVEPSMNSIGGRNQILVRTPSGEVHGIDGTTVVPAGYDPATAPRASHGYPAIGVPGAAAGLLRLHEAFGSLPLAVVVGPAIDYAEHGFRLLPGEARRHAGAVAELSESVGASRYFLRADGSPYGPGERLVQGDLARTLRTIVAGGAEAFYRGPIAESIAADMAENGGFVTLASLAAYEAEDARIVRGDYRGHELVAPDIPASGAIAIQALHIAEHFDPDAMSDEAWASVLGQSLALALADYRRLGSDTAAVRATSKAWARERARLVRVPQAVEAGAPEHGRASSDRPAASRGRDAATGRRGTGGPARRLGPEPGHTTHLSTADRDGMTVALTQTLGPSMGSKVATPGLGFLYAVTLGGYLGVSEPGERARSGITPLMALRDGEPRLVLGAAGGLRIISAVVQALSRVVDDGLSLPDALAAPRVHPLVGAAESDRASGLAVEAGVDDGWSPASLGVFEAFGLDIEPAAYRGAFGRVHGLAYDPDTGVWTGAADPDWEGAAVAPRTVPANARDKR